MWPDQSGNANHAFSTTTPARPVWVTNAINGLPVVRFYTTNSFSTNLSRLITNWTEAEAFVVLRVATNKPTSGRGLWRIGSGASGNGTAYPDLDGEITDSFGSKTGNINVGSTSQGLTNFHLYNPMSRNGEWVVRLNGAIKYRSASNSVGFYANPTLGSAAAGNFDGDIAEVLLYNRALTATERQNVNQYLQSRYRFMTPPGPPTNLTANVLSAGQISVWWSRAANNEQTVYSLERSTNGSVFTVVTQIEGASFIDSGLLANTTYSYRVKAANIAGESVYTSTISATTSVSGTDMLLDPNKLQIWLKADTGALVNYDGTLDSWLDSSGNTNIAVYGGPSANRPLWLRSGGNFNSHPVVQFFRTNWFEVQLQNRLTNWTNAEAFVVLRAASTNVSDPAPGLWRFGVPNSLYPNSAGNIQESFATHDFALITSVGNTITSPHLYNPYSIPGEWTARINGAVVFTRGVNTVEFYSSTPTLGEGLNPFGGDIVECLIYNQVLSAGQRSTTSDYLRLKYNLW